MPRVVKKQQAEVRHDPLYKELAEDDLVQKFGRVSKPGKRVKSSTKKNEEGGKEEVSILLCIPTSLFSLYIILKWTRKADLPLSLSNATGSS